MTRASRQHTHANRAAAAQALMATFLKNTRNELYIGLRVVHGVGLVGEKKGLRPMAGATARFLDVLIGQIKPSIIIPLAKRDSLPTHEAEAETDDLEMLGMRLHDGRAAPTRKGRELGG